MNQEASGAGLGAGGLAVPEDHRCGRCGYPSGRSGSVVCPECGWEVTPGEIASAERMRESLAAWQQRGRARWQAAWVAIVAGYWVALSVLGRHFGVALPWGIATGVLLPLSWTLGLLVSRGFPVREHRAFVRMTWERQLWMLHLPWLVMPALAIVFLALGLVDRFAGTDGSLYLASMLLVGVLWLLGCLLSLAAWWEARGEALAIAGVQRAGWSNRLGFVGGLLVVVGAGVSGFWGGAAAGLVIGISTGALMWD